MNDRPDPRLFPYRDDIAARGLEQVVSVPRYVDGERRQVTATVAPVMKAPAVDARRETEALFGETVTVFEDRDGWSWGQLGTDDYVGYLPTSALSAPGGEATHFVSVPSTFIYPAPDIKSCPPRQISLMALVGVEEEADGFARLEGASGYVYAAHLSPIGSYALDFVSVAETLVGTPYLWGGRQASGLDCSALVQIPLAATGMASPRDSDMQEASLGTLLNSTDVDGLRRGDLLFWKGHVGIMVDAERMIHANAHHMQVAIEGVRGAVERIASTGSPVTSIRRMEG